ncbi:MAG: hypothetical protein IT556_17215, partial [Acetobacteraceae bacterium]|nr:hypothetical protein [Acetobacteraceae bacterium]
MAFINGTNGNDTIRTAAAGGSLGGLPDATDLDDTINGLGGDDLIAAGGGNDQVDGGDGRDYTYGGAGDDVLRTGDNSAGASERLFGETGNDDLTGSLDTGNLHFLFGGDGNDTIHGRTNSVNLADYADRTLGVVANLALGTAVVAGSETDTLVDVRGFRGGVGNDQVTGSDFSDIILPGLGNNVIAGGAGLDSLRYGDIAGSVSIDLATGTAIKSADGSTDSFSGIEGAQGTNGDDTLLGDGNDNEFRGLAGTDLIDGRAGFDIINYNSFFRGSPGYFAPTGDFPLTAGVSVNLAAGTATDPWGFTDTLVSIETAQGTPFADDMTGVALAGGARSQLRGLGGNDTIRGTGADTSITASYTNDPAAVKINFGSTDAALGGVVVAAGTAHDGFGGTDTLIGVRSARGSAQNDVIQGGTAGDRLEGEGG